MKDVCRKTGLTERTIRFYIEKELIKPLSQEMNGWTYYEYTQETVSQLKRVVALRKAEFPFESILEMRHCPDNIDSIVRERYQLTKHTLSILPACLKP